MHGRIGVSASPLNDAIRDVLADFSDHDRATSNREVAEEVTTRQGALVDELATSLAMAELVKRVRNLRKNSVNPASRGQKQLEIPGMEEHLARRLPAEIPRYPEELSPYISALEDAPESYRQFYEPSESGGFDLREDAFDHNDIPWGNLWTSTVAEVRRYRQKLAAGIKADQRREKAIRELLDMTMGCGEDVRLIDAVQREAAAR